MIDKNTLNQISLYLDLEKMSVSQKIEILCFPKNNDDDFNKRLEEIKNDFKGIDFKVVHEIETIKDEVIFLEYDNTGN